MINIILLIVNLIILFFIFSKITKKKEQECPDVNLSCPDLNCPDISCPECPTHQCPKFECPKPNLSCPECPKMPKLECPKLECPEHKCPSVDHYLNRIDELENEVKKNTPIVCPTSEPCFPKEKIIFKPKLVEKDELTFSIKSSTGKQKMNITYNGGNIIANNIKLNTSFDTHTFKIKNYLFVETLEILIFGEGEVNFFESQVIFKNKNILKNEIRYYDHSGNLIFNSYPNSKAECHQGKLKHNGYVKIMVNPEDDLDKYFIH
jgi:hypothetical protein